MGRGTHRNHTTTPTITARTARALTTLLLSLTTSACESIPPQAPEHARALAAYHHATTDATLASFDTLATALSHTLDRTRETTDADWANSIDDLSTAAARFANLRAAADHAASLSDPAEVRAHLLAIRDDAAAAQQQFETHARTAAQTRTADLHALLNFQRAADRATLTLRTEIAAHHAVIARELSRQADLLDSYTAVADARHAALGARATTIASDLHTRAADLATPAADTAHRLAEAIRILTTPHQQAARP